MYDGYFMFSMLTTLHHFSFITIKKSTTLRKVKEQIKLFCLKSITTSTSRQIYNLDAPFDKNHILKLLACVQTPNYCCVVLWVYQKFLHIKKHSVPLNESLYLLLTSWTFHCVEMFNCIDISWKVWLTSEPFSVSTNNITQILNYPRIHGN